jgi:hypothetical protein
MKILLSLGRALGVLASLFFASHSSVQAAPLVTGVDVGVVPEVKVFEGQLMTRSFLAYPATFLGGVRVASGDVDGDGDLDIITAPGPGMGPQVKVFDGTTGLEIRSFFAYNTGFNGGVFVAAGDIDGDGSADIITGPDDGTITSELKVFRGTNLAVIANFAPYGIGYNDGVRVAAGDVNGDGRVDIITGAADTPHVKVFHGQTKAEIASFIAFSPAILNSGVFVAAGDVNGDGAADIIAGAGANAAPQVRVFNGRTGADLRSFFAYELNFKGGVRVASGDVNGDGRADLTTSPGPGRSPQIKNFNGRNGAFINSFSAYDSTITAGVFAGSSTEPPVRVITNPATDITVTTATLHGSVDANDRTVAVKFQYGPSTAYGKSVFAEPAEVSGTNPTAVTANISGLLPGKTYHFRAIASDGIGGIVVGNDRVFVTSTNKAPSGGDFAVTPASPVPSGTVLTAAFTGWIDEDGHIPLKYEVREGNIVIAPASEDASPSFILSPGTHILTGFIYDTLGASAETVEVEVVVEGEPDTVVTASGRDDVPSAGTGGVPAEATWTTFGVPAIADGSVKHIAGFTSPTGRGSGIFSDGTPVVLIGAPVPTDGTGAEFAIPATAVFKKFKDPVTDASGRVAFIATIGGAGVGANNTVVVSNGRTGTLEVIARKGFPAPGADGAKYASFLGVSINGGGTLFTARLGGAVRATNNQGAWWLPAGGTNAVLLVRKGGPGFQENETIKSFVILQTWPSTPGHGRAQIDGDEALFFATLSTGRQAQVLATPGALDGFALTGGPLGEGSIWVRMAQPSSGDGGTFMSVKGVYRSGLAAPSDPSDTGILTSANGGTTWAPLVALNDPAVGTDALWIDLGYPVNSGTSGDLAFLGKVKGGTVKSTHDTGIWWKSGAGGVRLLAQEGTQAVGCAVGEKFSSFRSLALPGGTAGPLFVAKLAGGGVNSRNDTGAWAADSSGSLRLLFRENQRIGTKRVLSFNFLSEVSGSPGATRAFNGNGQVAWRATFTDGTTGIVVTEIP